MFIAGDRGEEQGEGRRGKEEAREQVKSFPEAEEYAGGEGCAGGKARAEAGRRGEGKYFTVL